MHSKLHPPPPPPPHHAGVRCGHRAFPGPAEPERHNSVLPGAAANAAPACGLVPGARIIEDNKLLVEHGVLLVAESDPKRILARTELGRYQHQYNARTAHAICKELGDICAPKRAVERCGDAFLPTEDAAPGSIPRNAFPAHFTARLRNTLAQSWGGSSECPNAIGTL